MAWLVENESRNQLEIGKSSMTSMIRLSFIVYLKGWGKLSIVFYINVHL